MDKVTKGCKGYIFQKCVRIDEYSEKQKSLIGPLQTGDVETEPKDTSCAATNAVFSFKWRLPTDLRAWRGSQTIPAHSI